MLSSHFKISQKSFSIGPILLVLCPIADDLESRIWMQYRFGTRYCILQIELIHFILMCEPKSEFGIAKLATVTTCKKNVVHCITFPLSIRIVDLLLSLRVTINHDGFQSARSFSSVWI